MKNRVIKMLEGMRAQNESILHSQMLPEDEIIDLYEENEALDDALCELRMIPEYNRDELMASLRYAQEHLAVDYSGMDDEAVEKLDDSLDAIFGIVEKLIGEEEES